MEPTVKSKQVQFVWFTSYSERPEAAYVSSLFLSNFASKNGIRKVQVNEILKSNGIHQLWFTLMILIHQAETSYCKETFIHSLVFSLEGRAWQEPEPSHVTGMALAHCLLGKFLGVVCHCFLPPLDIPTLAARCLRPQRRERS